MSDDFLTRVSQVEPYVTADGSTIRELQHPDHHAGRKQSLAEATLEAGCSTQLHRHHVTEEIYHITQGSGLMTLGDEHFSVAVGDSICISPGTAHCIENTGDVDLKLLCCCSPAYSHEDTEIIALGST